MDISQYIIPTGFHGGAEKNCNEMMKMLLIVAGIVIILLIIFIYIKNRDKKTFVISKYTEPVMLDPLTSSGWEVIVMDSCPWCIKQKEILTKHFPDFKNIYNNKPANAVPAWQNTKTGKVSPGFKSFEQLQDMIKNP